MRGVLSAGLLASITLAMAAARINLDGAVQARTPDDSEHVTFWGDVAPLLYDHCVVCHRPGGSSAFSLLTFDEARQHARQIAVVTARRTMPPWKADQPMGTFVGDRRLDAHQIATFQQWIEQGVTEGDPRQAPPRPEWPTGWQLGKPDLVLTMKEPYTLRAGGPDMFRNFIIPIPLDSARYVRAWEFHSGNSRAVHHSTLQIDPVGAAHAFDAGEAASGFEGLIAPSARAPDGFFLDWAPGHQPSVAVDGTAWPIPPRSDLVMMLHLRPTGREETIQASVGLYFSDKPPAKVPVMVRLTREDLDIPAGEPYYSVTDSYTLPVDADLYTAQPHAHYLAQSIRGTATMPGVQRERTLISVDKWDFDWQDVYTYTKPVFLPAGTTLHMKVEYDNSSANIRNPNRPPKRVTYGQQTSDEMAELWLQVVPRRDEDRATLVTSLRAKVVPQEIAGRRLMVAKDPGNVALRNEMALLYEETGDPASAYAAFLDALRVAPDSAPAQFNVGQALVELGREPEAGSYFEQALAIDPRYANAHFAIGQLRQRAGQYDAAVVHYREALEVKPDDPDVLFNLGVTADLIGRRSEGIASLRRALVVRPAWPAAMGSLAWILAVSPASSADERQEAVALAEHAERLMSQANAGLLDILASALASVGRFDRAVIVAQQAADLAEARGDRATSAAIRQRLDLFKHGTPYQDGR